MDAALYSCAKCHTDENKTLYNGRSVHTPHGGTYGYPVVNGKWVWAGLPDAERQQKTPELQRIIQNVRTQLVMPSSGRDPDDVRRSAEFHALHIHRVKAVGSLPSNAAGE